MTCFADLERIINSHGTSDASPADILAEQGCPSTSIAILDHGDIVSHCVSTVGDDVETLFQACSISKPIAGMATMRLVQEGKLRLDDKIVNVLPRSVVELLETPKTKCLVADITVRHLMSHTSGLSVHGLPGYSGNPPTVMTVLSGKAPANTLHVRLEGVPGHIHAYSGGGITVLQTILETVTGKEFPSLVRELVLEPLGMSRSFYSLPSGETNTAKAHYTGYTACEDQWRVNPEQAAAGLWTTPTDLLKAVRAMQESLTGTNGASFLERDIAQQMLTEVSTGMALTWCAPKDPGVAFGHSGSNLPGWRCFVIGYADLLSWRKDGSSEMSSKTTNHENCGICVMTNSAAGDAVIWKVVHGISLLKQWTQVPCIYASPVATIPFATNNKVDAKWIDWTGAWEDKDQDWVLKADSDGFPILQYGKVAPVKLAPAAIPSKEHPEGQSIDLVLEDLEILIRLGWNNGKRTMELWHGGSGEIYLLERE